VIELVGVLESVMSESVRAFSFTDLSIYLIQ